LNIEQKSFPNRLHSWLTPKCERRQTIGKGIGLFASAAFVRNELVAVWGGIIITNEELAQVGSVFPHVKTNAIEIYPSFFLSSVSLTSIDDAERFNHSCDPNVGLKGHLVLLARRAIQIGEELTIDYETISISVDESFSCRCGQPNCRGKLDGSIIRNANWVNNNRGWLSPVIADQAFASFNEV
jgi:hypothetical protein